MCSLHTFQAPPGQGYVTAFEKNSEFVAVQAENRERESYAQIQHYPKVVVTRDSLRSSLSKETARSAFLEHEETVWRKVINAWHEHGSSGVLEELANGKNEVSTWLSSVSRGMLAFVRWTSSLHGSLFPHLTLSSEEMAAVFSSNLDWKSGPIRAFAWHPHATKFAMALQDDSVKVYTAQSAITPNLRHKLQKGVAALAWKPLSSSVLAIACQSCVLIWHVDPLSLATRPSTSSCQVLQQNGHGPITSLAWSPNSSVLVSASPADTAIMVWDVAKETCVPLRRVGGGGVSLLSWSPDGSKLLAASPSSVFRVWQCRSWTCERWSKLSGRVQSACWSPDATTLLFTTAGEPIIYSLSFSKSQDVTTDLIGGSKVAVSCVDLSEVMIENVSEQLRVGGIVQNMVWDPSGERLAVHFAPNEDYTSPLVAVFQTRIHPVLEIMPCGFVRGDLGETPHIITFQPKFDMGALLTIIWSSGRIAYIPMYFVPSATMKEQGLPQESHLNGSLQSQSLYSQGL